MQAPHTAPLSSAAVYSAPALVPPDIYLPHRDMGRTPVVGIGFGGHAIPGLPHAVPTAHLEAIIIWDWDDTLMCSSAINANQLLLHQAHQLEAVLEQVLTLSMRLGETCIVTNADELWVLESTRRFAPRVLPLLSQIPVVSARRKYERSCPGDVFAWKRETFREVLAARRSSPLALNLVVLGDSPAEMEAAQTATLGMMVPMVIKTVKFKEAPTVEELLEQLRVLVQELSIIVADDKSSCRNLTQWMRPQLGLPHSMMSYFPGPLASTMFTYSPTLLPAPYAVPSTYLGAPMIYATGH